jgi:ankyrin repeat protein
VAEVNQHAAAHDRALLELFRAIASGQEAEVARRLRSSSALAGRAIQVGASRTDPEPFFLVPIRHYVYAGDTALHIAAAAHRRELAAALVELGADVRGRNRRGAEPLHYAADGDAGGLHEDAEDIGGLVADLVEGGADPNAIDASGVAPLHRAVRSRSASVVGALLRHGADPMLRNGSGSTPLHLAVQNTGRSGSGSESARDAQARIIAMLLAHGASPTDLDAKGKTVSAAAGSERIRALLQPLE